MLSFNFPHSDLYFIVVCSAFICSNVYKVNNSMVESLAGGVEAVFGASIVILILSKDVYSKAGDERTLKS